MRISDWSSDVCSSDLVDLLGGKSATLNLYPGSEFSISVTGALDATVMGALAAVENRGRLEANGGVVYLHARLAAAVLDDAVNHSGTIDATGLEIGRAHV